MYSPGHGEPKQPNRGVGFVRPGGGTHCYGKLRSRSCLFVFGICNQEANKAYILDGPFSAVSTAHGHLTEDSIESACREIQYAHGVCT